MYHIFGTTFWVTISNHIETFLVYIPNALYLFISSSRSPYVIRCRHCQRRYKGINITLRRFNVGSKFLLHLFSPPCNPFRYDLSAYISNTSPWAFFQEWQIAPETLTSFPFSYSFPLDLPLILRASFAASEDFLHISSNRGVATTSSIFNLVVILLMVVTK